MPESFRNMVLINTGAPTGFELDVLRRNPLQTLQDLTPFLLWRSAVTLLGGIGLPGIRAFFRTTLRFSQRLTNAYLTPYPDAAYMAGVIKSPMMVPIYRDDPVAQHMVEAKRKVLKKDDNL